MKKILLNKKYKIIINLKIEIQNKIRKSTISKI